MRRRKRTFPWLGLGVESAMLAIEAQQVIALRLCRLAGGGATARREAARMVTEKVAALADSQRLVLAAAARGKGMRGTRQAVGLYRKRVTANRKRLSKSKT